MKKLFWMFDKWARRKREELAVNRLAGKGSICRIYGHQFRNADETLAVRGIKGRHCGICRKTVEEIVDKRWLKY